jgi:predicted membrane protein (TIGR00267 family)
MAASFVMGAMIPIVPYFVLEGTAALYLSIAFSALTLFAVGVFKGRLAGKSQLRSGIRFFAIAVSAALLGYLIGLVVQYFFPDISIPA